MSEVRSADDIDARLRRLEDERDIRERLYRYGHALDYGREEAWVDCFTEDGVFDVRTRSGEQFMKFQGRDELRSMAAGHTRAPAKYHKHFVVDPVIEIDGDTARVDSYFARLDADDDGGHANVVSIGRYRDELVRCPDQVWRFSVRRAEMEDH